MFIIDDLLTASVRGVGLILGKVLTIRHSHTGSQRGIDRTYIGAIDQRRTRS